MALRRWGLLVVALAALSLSASCTHGCGHHSPDDTAFKRFDEVSMQGFRVWKHGSGEPVVVFHEIPGLTDDTFKLGEEISKEGFTVYIPLMFGKPRQFAVAREFVRQCIFGRRFQCWNRASSGPIARQLLPLVNEINKLHGDKGLAAVGMCLTGDLPLELIGLDAPIRAAMLSQPTLPFGNKTALAAPDEAITKAKERKVQFVAARFKADTKSPHARMAVLEERLKGQLTPFELDSNDKHAHAVLTGCLDVEPGTRDVLNTMLTIFREALPK